MTGTDSRSHKTTEIDIERAHLDFASVRIQFAFGLMAALIFVALFLTPFIFTPFLACDYLAAENLFPTQNMRVDAPPITQPAAWLTYAEIIVFAHHAWMYRLLNLVAVIASAVFAGLVAMDIANRYGTRSSGAIALWTSLFFIVERWNAQSFASIAATPSVVSNLFGIAALFFDLRFRLLKERWYFVLAVVLLFGAAALDIRGALVALAGILLSRVLIHSNASWPLRSLGSAGGALIYILLPPLSTLICPQGVEFSTNAGILQSVTSLFSDLLVDRQIDGLTVLRIAFYMYIAFAVIVGLFRGRDKPALFAVLWLVMALLCTSITFETYSWLKASDYVSPLIFFAAPISLMIAMIPLRGLDTMEQRVSAPIARIGAVALSVVFVIVGALLVSDMNRYATTARELDNFKTKLIQKLDERRNPTLVVNPPFHKAGYLLVADGGIVTKPYGSVPCQKIMNSMLRAPLSKVKHDGYLFFATDHGMLAVSRGAPDPNHAGSPTFRWNGERGELERISYEGADQYSQLISRETFDELRCEPENAKRVLDAVIKSAGTSPWLQPTDSSVRFTSGWSEPLIVWFPETKLNPVTIENVKLVTMDAIDAHEKEPLRLVWRNQTTAMVDDGIPFQFAGKGYYFASTGSDPAWLQNPTITQVGVRIPAGSRSVQLQLIETISDNKDLPN